ncbi:alkaline phosphatase [Vibrio sp. CAU 1672]|uniref:alkaline phosphatase n=1 Tax=Vibrio sp. CAU 1672 TaxID=3032594 RepID=UPI0023DA2BC6|nr:alkaline phosphatase [Vibrio sp. CAU 1672]MDF2153087.1 alkaline phosphatase [Vibrio sp. CAU 1672]
MDFQTHKLTSVALLTALAVMGCNSGSSTATSQPKAKNVILMISDGASDGAWDLSSYWTHGAKLNDTAPYSGLDSRLAMTTFPLNTNNTPADCTQEPLPQVSYDPDQVWDETLVNETDGNYTRPFAGYSYLNKSATDSAAAGSALATGHKTYNNAISVDYCGQPLKTITQVAKKHGRATGIVTSVQFNHATPAVFAANHTSRNDYSQLGTLMLTSGMADLIMGAGHPEFDMNGARRSTLNYKYLSENDWHMLQQGALFPSGSAQPWTVIESKEAFQQLANNSSAAEIMHGPLFGLVQNDSTLQQNRTNCTSEQATIAFGCPFTANVPTLKTMTKGAINYLSQNENGFFLMIEGGAVDWAAHANHTARIIEEQVDFNNAVQAVFDWVEAYSDWDETLLIVTTDHGNSYVLGASSDQNAYAPVENPGQHIMPDVKYYSGNHTQELVRLYMKGAGASLISDYIAGNDPQYAEKYNHTGANGDYVDNTNVFDVMKSVLVN